MEAATVCRVTIRNTGTELLCRSDQTVLEAAVAAGLDYPYTCATGNCGACVSLLESGEVTLLPRSDASLSPDQVRAGHTLACRARPMSDLVITWLGRGRR
jgi:ferredoxin